MKIKNLFMLACTACLLFSCKSGSTVNKTTTLQDTDVETAWGLKSIKTKKVSFGEGSRVVYIHFNPESKIVSGYAGCNRFFGNYEEPTTGKLVLSHVGSTKMACPEHEMELEDMFLSVLNKVNGYRITEDTLELLHNDDVVMTFEKTLMPQD
ncbi:MAG: META domain-containing protein [Bacteroidales bacterium]|nr:META domain-containing protein [Bacteroidales bacterium]